MINARIIKVSSGKRGAGTALAAASLAALLGLSACEERPYPQPVKSYAEQPQPAAPLAGAPASAPAPAQAPAYAASPAPEASYAPPARAYSSGAIVAMAPIPNPPESGRHGYGHRVHSRYATAPIGGEYAPASQTPAHPAVMKPAYAKAAPAYNKPAYNKPTYTKPAATYAVAAPKPAAPKMAAPQMAAPKMAAPKMAAPKMASPKMAVAPAPAPVKKPEPPKVYAAAKPVAPPMPATLPAAKPVAVAKEAVKDAGKVAAAAPVIAKAAEDKSKAMVAAAPAKPAMNAADRATRLAALQSALTDAISKNAALKTPDRFTANQPVDVTLTVPASFADTLKAEADKNGLTDAAASANVTAVLSGDGFSVTPDETLSLPLTPGQPTEFRWTVTALPNAKGPLHADVGVDLLGGGSDTLTLGSVQKQAGLGIKPTARVIGLGLLVLIALLIVGWLARGRGPSRPASARRAARAARNAPMDMGANDPAH